MAKFDFDSVKLSLLYEVSKEGVINQKLYLMVSFADKPKYCFSSLPFSETFWATLLFIRKILRKRIYTQNFSMVAF